MEQRTQREILAGDQILSRLLENSEAIRTTNWYQSFSAEKQSERKQDLQNRLTIRLIPETKLIAVSATTSVPADAKIIVDELVDRYLMDRRTQANASMLGRTQVLQQLYDSYARELETVDARLRELSRQMSTDGQGIPGRISAKELELQQLMRNLGELRMLAAKANDEFETARTLLQQGQDPPAVGLAVAMADGLRTRKYRADEAELRVQSLELRMGASNPSVEAARRERDVLKAQYREALEAEMATARVQVMEGLASAKMNADRALAAATEEVERVKRDSVEMNSNYAEYLARTETKRQLTQKMKELEQGRVVLSQTATASNVIGATWMARPEVPEMAYFPRLSLSVAITVALGLLLAIGVAFLREVMDTSVRSPRDVARVGQMNMLGAIPDQAHDPQSIGGRLPLAIFETPTSMIAEQFRQMRTRLQHAASLDTTRSILVSSANPSDGKSTVACNLAAGLALNGRRILLVDANFRRPALHTLFGLDNSQGFSDALNRLEGFADVVKETPVPNLSVVTSGPRPANATELLESQLLSDFIERALEEYDHVIFDSGPLLFVSESMALAPRVDGVVTVVRARSCSRGLLQRTRDALKAVKAEHLGVVLNAVRSMGGGYYSRNIRTYYEYQGAQ